MSRDDDFDTLEMMQRFGGGFVKALAEAAYKADSTNYEILKKAFPEYWAQYEGLAKRTKQHEG